MDDVTVPVAVVDAVEGVTLAVLVPSGVTEAVVVKAVDVLAEAGAAPAGGW